MAPGVIDGMQEDVHRVMVTSVAFASELEFRPIETTDASSLFRISFLITISPVTLQHGKCNTLDVERRVEQCPGSNAVECRP